MVLVKQADGHRNSNMINLLNRPILFFAVCLVAGFDLVMIARAIAG